MIKSITAINYLGESVTIILTELEPEHGFYVKKIDGLGPADGTINTTELATNDGSLYNSARLSERNIVMNLLFGFADNIEDSRQRTYKFFPIKKPVSIQIDTDNRSAIATGYVESNEPEIFSKQEGNQISIICPDPFFYSAGVKNETYFYGAEPLFEFIFSNESLEEPLLEMGEIRNQTEQTIIYEGDAEIGITMTIHAIGEVGNITIYNTGTREIMKIDVDKIYEITGTGIVAGDDIIINTVRGNKYVRLLREGRYTNILNALVKGSDWFQLARGENVFAYRADSGTSNLQFKIENQIIYEGI